MYRHIFDRSDLDAVVGVTKEGVRITRREDLEKSGGGRSDVVLYNGTRSGNEYALYVRPEGFFGDVWILDTLSDDEHAHVMAFAEKMRTNAKEFPPAYKLLW